MVELSCAMPSWRHRWWAKGHRSHHRYTDTELDPYSALNGILYCHIGWQLVKPRVKPGHADTIDLSNDAVVQWQHQNYFVLVLIFGYILPAIIGGVFWRDAWGAFYYAGLLRMTVVHHVSASTCLRLGAHLSFFPLIVYLRCKFTSTRIRRRSFRR